LKEYVPVAFGRPSVPIAACIALAAIMASGAPALAQGFFDFFNNGGNRGGGWFGQQQRQYAPQQASPYADPNHPGSDRYGSSFGGQGSTPSSGTGRSVSYCVRLCDGRYFPIQRTANANPVQLCSAFCPAAKTQIYNGSQIDHAYASGGGRYADLPNAFAFRQRIVPDCTCNGKDSVGLAKIDIASDPTLRQGDIVATGDNVKAALIAMHAAKERARDVNAERQAPEQQRNAGRRTATAAPVPPPSAVPATPAEATEDVPED
jgi:hypothetical protein